MARPIVEIRQLDDGKFYYERFDWNDTPGYTNKSTYISQTYESFDEMLNVLSLVAEQINYTFGHTLTEGEIELARKFRGELYERHTFT